ncbi:MAG: RNase adapter RapZ [Deltaproteobacteria bacterium]|nr:RNase adapter RapZ [Myxococcales bacterium]MDP3217400.1 RNase adapter RapZ [Deltaproteobacteria bacterium]
MADAVPLIVVVTGLSGAGRSTALRVLEDLSFDCIDNLPTPLIEQAVALSSSTGSVLRMGIGMDVRVRAMLEGAGAVIDALRAHKHRVSVIFLDAADEALVRRYSESRRPHPLAAQHPGEDLAALITRERERLADLRARADRVIDTSALTVHDLRRLLIEHFTLAEGATLRMSTRVLSFGFKYGIPADADLVFDARFLPNPHFVPALRPRSGKDPAVAGFVLDTVEGREFIDAIETMLTPLLPRYAREGKVALTVAIGCTGGRHRSVAITEALAVRLSKLRAPGDVRAAHRDIDRGG